MTAAPQHDLLSPYDQLRLGREIIEAESDVLQGVAKRLDFEFCRAVELLYCCQSSVIVTGVGKAGLIGQKVAATLASTGSRSHFLHPTEALHGDLGRVHHKDVVIVFSQSGATEEIVKVLPPLLELGVPIIAVTGNTQSTLASCAIATIDLGKFAEADPMRLAPSSSTTAMLAVGDALALVTSRLRGVGPEDFARFHPGGSLGRKLSNVEDVMQPLSRCRISSDQKTIRDVFVSVSRPERRTGAIMLVDGDHVLTGIFTDSDLARLFERKADEVLDQPIADIMTKAPVTAAVGTKFEEAVTIMANMKISELPITDADGRPVGLIDITDVVGLLPGETQAPDDVLVSLRIVNE